MSRRTLRRAAIAAVTTAPATARAATDDPHDGGRASIETARGRIAASAS